MEDLHVPEAPQVSPRKPNLKVDVVGISPQLLEQLKHKDPKWGKLKYWLIGMLSTAKETPGNETAITTLEMLLDMMEAIEEEE